MLTGLKTLSYLVQLLQLNNQNKEKSFLYKSQQLDAYLVYLWSEVSCYVLVLYCV